MKKYKDMYEYCQDNKRYVKCVRNRYGDVVKIYAK